MATTSFKTPPKTAAAEPEPTQAVQVVPPASVPAPSMVTNAQLEGEFTSRDMAIPYLSLGQKSGTMTDGNPGWIGKFVYDKSLLLGEKITIVAMSMKKSYEEVTEYGSEQIPMRFNTAAEARDSGVEYREVAQIDLLVEALNPDLRDFATVIAGDRYFLPARWVVRSSSYGRVVGTLLRDLASWLKGDLSSGFYEVFALKQSGKGNTWYVPVLKTGGRVPDDVRAQIKARMGV